jgi:hypothetical protein
VGGLHGLVDQTAATGLQANSTPQPTQWMVSATVPAAPCSGNGLGTGLSVWVIGSGARTQPITVAAVAAMLATATGRQRGGPTLVGQPYGTVTTPGPPWSGPDFRVGDLGCDAGLASGEPAGMARTGGADVDP